MKRAGVRVTRAGRLDSLREMVVVPGGVQYLSRSPSS